MVLSLAVLAARPHEFVTQEQALLAAAITVLGLAPSFHYLLGGARSPLPLLELSGVFYASSFGLPVYSPELAWWPVSEQAITKALSLSLLGVAMLYLGYWLSGQTLFAALRPVRLGWEVPVARLRAVGWLFVSTHLVYLFAPSLSQLPSLGHVLDPLGWIALGILYPLALGGRLPMLERAALYGIFLPLEALGRFASGSLAQLMMLVGFMVLIYWNVRRRVPWLPVVLGAAFFVFVNPVKHEFRMLAWEGSEADSSVLRKVELFAELTLEHYAGDWSDRAVHVSTVNRLGHIAAFAMVVEMTPSAVPYWGGETYWNLPFALIPRVLWPGKPEFEYGNAFGHRYHVLQPNDDRTTFNLPWLTEFYVNFGTWGVLIGMTLVGAAFRFLRAKLSNADASIPEHALGLTLVFGLSNAESNLALVWGGLALTFSAMYVILWLALHRYRW